MRILIPACLALLMTACSSVEPAPVSSASNLDQTTTALMWQARADNRAYEIVESLTTEVGPRLAGTEAEQRARDWAVATLTELGFSNVRVEPFTVPLWMRGEEYAAITSPFPQPLRITALGGSISTGPEGVEGQIVSLPSLAALQATPEGSLQGRIVFVDEVMARTQDGSGYALAVTKRSMAAYEAQRAGALAALIRSVGTSSHRFAHTGQMRWAWQPGAPGVPAAALSAPDADQLRRALARDPQVSVKLVITPQRLTPAASGNVIAEIPGRERPDEIVLVSAHLDSWDLGTGAIDDGAGVGIVVAAARAVLDYLPQAPRRTIRIVLFGSEEVGLVGARAYTERHAQELPKHVVASESDFGAGDIWRFDTGVPEHKIPAAQRIGQLLQPLGIGPGDNTARGGPDILFLRQAGVPVVTLQQNGWDYFDLHHTADDTLDKIGSKDLDQNVAAWAAFMYYAAEMPGDFR